MQPHRTPAQLQPSRCALLAGYNTVLTLQHWILCSCYCGTRHGIATRPSRPSPTRTCATTTTPRTRCRALLGVKCSHFAQPEAPFKFDDAFESQEFSIDEWKSTFFFKLKYLYLYFLSVDLKLIFQSGYSSTSLCFSDCASPYYCLF